MDAYTQTLLDEYACRRLMERYWYAQSLRDPDMEAEVFAEDARWGSAVGKDAIREQAKGFFTAMQKIRHLASSVGSINIDVDGDRATGFVHSIAHLVVDLPDGSQRITVTDALYYLEFARKPEGWLITSMTGKDDPTAPHDGSFQFNASMADVIDHGIVAE